MLKDFTHPRLGQEVQTQGGYYVPREEHLMLHKGREVVYVLGHAVVEASCCGSSAWTYIQVPGFLIRRSVLGDSASSVSEVETIEDDEDRDAVRETLLAKHPGVWIEIW